LVTFRLDGTLDRDFVYYEVGSAKPNLGAKSLNLYVTPTPPLVERNRIVAKVDQLLAQIDELSVRIYDLQARIEQ